VVVDPPLESEIVTIPRQASLAAIARSTGIDDDLLRLLNAELRQGVLPEDGYDLRVPSAEKSQVLTKLDDIPAYQAYPARKPQGTAVARHKVRKGETLQTISQKYGTDAKSILLANNMRRPAPLAAGTILRVPIACPPERSPTLPEPKAATAKRETIEHVVRQGDSLYNLAKRYGTTTEGIQRQNRVTASSLAIGQVLKITPAAAPAKSEAPRAKSAVYAVRNGDTVHSIAKRHNMAVDRLLALNQLNAKSKLQPGQKTHRRKLKPSVGNAQTHGLLGPEAALDVENQCRMRVAKPGESGKPQLQIGVMLHRQDDRIHPGDGLQRDQLDPIIRPGFIRVRHGIAHHHLYSELLQLANNIHHLGVAQVGTSSLNVIPRIAIRAPSTGFPAAIII